MALEVRYTASYFVQVTFPIFYNKLPRKNKSRLVYCQTGFIVIWPFHNLDYRSRGTKVNLDTKLEIDVRRGIIIEEDT